MAKDRNSAALLASVQPLAPIPARSGDGISGIIDGKVFMTIPDIGDGVGVHDFYCYEPERNRWSHALSSTPIVHKSAAGGVINNKFYVVGGNNDRGNDTGQLDIYDPATENWTTSPAAMPKPRHDAAGAVLDGRLYVLGGKTPVPDASFFDDVEIYDPVTDRWSYGQPLRSARTGSGAVVVNRTLYVVGGFDQRVLPDVPIPNLDALGPDGTWVALPPMPQAVGEAFVAEHNGIIYVAGGDGQPGQPQPGQPHDLGTLQAYSISNRKWAILAPMPEHRWNGCGAQWINDQLYIFGGWSNLPLPPLPYDTVFVYDPRKNSWRQ